MNLTGENRKKNLFIKDIFSILTEEQNYYICTVNKISKVEYFLHIKTSNLLQKYYKHFLGENINFKIHSYIFWLDSVSFNYSYFNYLLLILSNRINQYVQ